MQNSRHWALNHHISLIHFLYVIAHSKFEGQCSSFFNQVYFFPLMYFLFVFSLSIPWNLIIKMLLIPQKEKYKNFIAALFIIVWIWKEPRYPLIGQWRNKLWYNHTMKCCSAVKRHELLIDTIWMNCRNIMLSEKNALRKTVHTSWICWFEVIKKAKLICDRHKPEQ